MIPALLFAVVAQMACFFFFLFTNDNFYLMVYSGLAIFFFGLYVIIDLYVITYRIEVDDYILGALTLYLDLITIFLHLLRLLGNKK